MKIVQNIPPKTFAPVTLTLDSQEEVNIFTALIGGMTESTSMEFGMPDEWAINTYAELSRLSTPIPRRFTVKLKDE